MAAAVSTFGSLDVAVCNAGIVRAADFLEMSEDDFDAVIRVNLKGVFLVGAAPSLGEIGAMPGWRVVHYAYIAALVHVVQLQPGRGLSVQGVFGWWACLHGCVCGPRVVVVVVLGPGVAFCQQPAISSAPPCTPLVRRAKQRRGRWWRRGGGAPLSR